LAKWYLPNPTFGDSLDVTPPPDHETLVATPKRQRAERLQQESAGRQGFLRRGQARRLLGEPIPARTAGPLLDAPAPCLQPSPPLVRLAGVEVLALGHRDGLAHHRHALFPRRLAH